MSLVKSVFLLSGIMYISEHQNSPIVHQALNAHTHAQNDKML